MRGFGQETITAPC